MIPVSQWIERFVIVPQTKQPMILEPHQKLILDEAFRFDDNDCLPYDTVVYSCPKKSGKTAINAALCVYWAYNVESPNEIIISANTREQASSRAFEDAKRYIAMNPALNEMTELLGRLEIKIVNGSKILAIPNDAASIAGSNHGLISHDEIWGWYSKSHERLYAELTPPPTRKAAVRFVTTYAGFHGESVLLERIYKTIFNDKDEVREDVERPLGEDLPVYVKDGLFMYWDHDARMPWQSDGYYVKQRRDLRPAQYTRLHENRWVSSEQGLFTERMLSQCIDTNHRPPAPNKYVQLYVGVDASAKKDRTAVVSVYKGDDGRIYLGPKRFWSPSKEDPIDLEETVESYVKELASQYTVVRVRYDPYQLLRSAQTLAKDGLPMNEFPQQYNNQIEMANSLYDLIKYGNLVLYPDDDMKVEFLSCLAKETSRGVIIQKGQGRAPNDQIIALAMASLKPSRGFFDECNFHAMQEDDGNGNGQSTG